MQGQVGNASTVVCAIYLSVENNRQDESKAILGCVRHDVQSLDRSHSMLLMGDFNGHLVELNRRDDKNGQMLRQLAEDLELKILYLR